MTVFVERYCGFCDEPNPLIGHCQCREIKRLNESVTALTAQLEAERADRRSEYDALIQKIAERGGEVMREKSRADKAEAEAKALRAVLSPAWFSKMRTYLSIYRGDKELRGMLKAAHLATGEVETLPPDFAVLALTAEERRVLAEVAATPEKHRLDHSGGIPQSLLVLSNAGLIEFGEPEFIPSITDAGRATLAQPADGGK